jgi:TPR repeat protein
MGIPAWLTLAYAARDAGDQQRAVGILRDAASDGHLDALVQLAMMIWPEQESLADQLILDVEAQVTEDDADTHFALHHAYTLGIAAVPPGAEPESATAAYLRRSARRFHHLKVTAELDAHPRLQYSVGLHYWQGLNGVEKDDVEAERWLSLAAQSGEGDIVKDCRKFLREQTKKAQRRET